MLIRATAVRALLVGGVAVVVTAGLALTVALTRQDASRSGADPVGTTLATSAGPPPAEGGADEPLPSHGGAAARPPTTHSAASPTARARKTTKPRPATTQPVKQRVKNSPRSTPAYRPDPTPPRPPRTAPGGPGRPRPAPWFANKVGNAVQVVAVVGRGGSDATLSTWQKKGTVWSPVVSGVGAKVGAKGISSAYSESSTATPAGVFSLPSAFGRMADPGSGLTYLRVDTHDWWVSDVKSSLYNTHQRCAPGSCPFNEAASENLAKAGAVYDYAVVMGVNLTRKPGAGSAFFLHVSNGRATAGCVAIAGGTLTSIMRWLRPGAVIATTPS